VDWLPYAVNAVGLLGALGWILRLVATGKLHTDREFQAVINYYVADKAEDAATIKTLTETASLQAKTAASTTHTGEIVKTVMSELQRQAAERKDVEKDEG
jgi:hypothetical protein